MKNLYLLIFTFTSLFGFSQFPSNLKAYFTFNGSLNDSMGLSSPGINNGATKSADRMGLPNKAYEFDGTGKNIDISADLNFGTTTIAFWFQPTDFSNTIQVILSNLSNTSQVQTSQIEVFIDAAAKIEVGVGNVYMVPTYYRKFTSNNAINTNKWNHIAVVIDNNFSNAKLYINGVMDFNQAISGLTYSKCLNIMRLGSRFYPITESPYKGKIDEVMIFNKALSDIEVRSIYSLTNGIQKGTVAVAPDCNFYPNPMQSNNELKIAFSTEVSNLKLKVYNINGDEIAFTSSILDDKTISMKFENASAGVYYLKMEEGSLLAMKKFILLN